MHIYNMNKMKKQVKIELENRIEEHKQNYLLQIKLHNESYLVTENYIQGKNNKIVEDIFNIECNSVYKFITIQNKTIKSKNRSEKEFNTITETRIEFNKFKTCIIKDIEFKKCTFYGCKFDGCIFENVKFNECDFYEENSSTFYDGCVFNQTTFKNCNVKKSIFKDGKFNSIKFLESSLKDSIFENIFMKKIQINDCDCRMLKLINPSIENIKFEDEYRTKFDEQTFIDEIVIDMYHKKSYEDASKAYRLIATIFEKNNLLDYSGEYYYLSKKAENKALSGMDKIKSWMFWMLCGYGERPTYALVTSIEIILIFAVMYMFTGLVADGNLINYTDVVTQGNILHEGMYSDFLKSLYFSITTFTTVGYGDITPIGEVSTMLSGLEMFLGVTMVGIWTATLARKIIR